MGTVELLAMINAARALGLVLNTHDGGLKVTGPKMPEAAALVQQMAQHKAALIELLQTPLLSAHAITGADLAFTLADVDAMPIEPIAPTVSLPDLQTADLYTDIWPLWLTAHELELVRKRYPRLTLEAQQVGEWFALTAAYPVGATLWTSPKGRRYVA